MKTHIIQASVFPSYELCSEPSLYFRWESNNAQSSASGFIEFGQQKRVIIPKSTRVFTDTYFNSFSIGKWKNKIGLTDLALSLSFTGEIVLRWWWYQSQGRHASIGEVRLTSSDPVNSVHIPVSQFERLTDGVIAFEIFALADSVIHGFQYVTSMLPRREVRLAISITHFNRQQYVIPAVRRLNEQLLSSDPAYSNRVKLFVVDNSQNLKPEDMVGAQVIPNANLGGSGGFMRGLMHVQDVGEFTHCLFMDDDASNEIEAIRRTITLLEYAIDDKTAISGAMFYEQRPYIQHENGAWFSGVCSPRGIGLDVRNMNCIVENEIDEAVDYGGWWFFAFPLQYVTRYAFPFFVRGDDIYFGLKNQFPILTLNGICSWQEDFAVKDSPLTAYLDIRSGMIQSLLGTFPNANKNKLLRLLRNAFKSYLWTYHYESGAAFLDAIEDVIKGPDFWLNNVDMSVRRPEIMKRIKNEKMQDLPTDWRRNFRWSDKSRKKRLNRRLTLNGHLLPLFTFRKYNVAIAKGFGGRINDSFRCKKVLCVDVLSQKGYVVEHDKKAFFTQLLRYYRLRYRFWRDYDKLRAAYNARESDLTSRDFWQAQFVKEI